MIISQSIGSLARRVAVCSLLVGSVGCAANSQDDHPEAEDSIPGTVEDVGSEGTSPGSRHEVLADVDVGYGTVTFHRLDTADGQTRVAVSESAPNNYRTTPFSKLAASELTHLELFRALQPGVTAPPLLTALHEAEAQGLGRETAEVREVSFDRAAVIEKSPASCQAWVFEDPPDNCGVRTWSNGRKADYVSGSVGLHVGQNWAFATTKPVTLGICNESNSTINGRIGIDQGGDSSSAYSYWGWATVPQGTMWRWWDFRSVRGCSMCNGNVCAIIAGCYYPSRYRVDGSSAAGKSYHLYTAEAYQPNCFDL